MIYRIFQKIEPTLIRVYRKASSPPTPNLTGDRDIEYSWIAANMPRGPGEALDFGCGPSWLGLLAARRGFKVTAIDLGPVIWHYQHPFLNFVQGDILNINFPLELFDLVINCSTIEHVGLSGRYGVTDPRDDGDIQAMGILRGVMKPNGIMLLTIPVGRDRVFKPLHRVYAHNRLPKLLDGWEILSKEYWIKNGQNRWISVEETVALNKEPSPHCFGLGLFVVRPRLK